MTRLWRIHTFCGSEKERAVHWTLKNIIVYAARARIYTHRPSSIVWMYVNNNTPIHRAGDWGLCFLGGSFLPPTSFIRMYGWMEIHRWVWWWRRWLAMTSASDIGWLLNPIKNHALALKNVTDSRSGVLIGCWCSSSRGPVRPSKCGPIIMR